MSEKPQGRRYSEDVDLLTNYLQAIRSAQETLRLLTSSAVDLFLAEEQVQALAHDDYGYDSGAVYELLAYREHTLRQKDHLERLGHLADHGGINIGSEPCG
jgi:hypothetical protein